MVTIFDELASNIDRISESAVMEALYDNTELLDEMLNANREQMLSGKDALNGGDLGIYSKETERTWNTAKPRTTKVQAGDDIILKDTGRLQRDLQIKIDKGIAKIKADSKDQFKVDYLESYYDQDSGKFLGLNPDSLGMIQNLIVQQRYAHGIYYNLIRYGRT
jgi:hypothetical protein